MDWKKWKEQHEGRKIRYDDIGCVVCPNKIPCNECRSDCTGNGQVVKGILEAMKQAERAVAHQLISNDPKEMFRPYDVCGCKSCKKGKADIVKFIEESKFICGQDEAEKAKIRADAEKAGYERALKENGILFGKDAKDFLKADKKATQSPEYKRLMKRANKLRGILK